MKRAANAEERRHLSRVAGLGCIVCGGQAIVHHIRDGYGTAQRAPHHETIPLCPQHHQGYGHGISFHDGPETWQLRYGTERALLEQVRAELTAIYGGFYAGAEPAG